MSDSDSDGGPAFPTGITGDNDGMSLRDWFAGQALAGMSIVPDYSVGPCNSFIVERAFIIADAMVKARNR